MSRMFHSSGDILADRRFDYAQAASAEGDHATAEDMLQQTLELAPDWAPAWFALGEARLALGRPQDAIEAYRRCRALDPDDAQGAGVALAALGGETGAAMSPAYVRGLFDQYAERFDAHLTKHLAYRGPELIRDAIVRASAAEGIRTPFARALDLGCGTGLFGEALGDLARALDGVDLSPRMIRKAKNRGCYDTLADGDMIAFLAAAGAERYDLIAAADVFVYVGDLAPAFAGVGRALKRRGLFAFSIQTSDGADYALGPERRYSHDPAYAERALRAAGFAPLRMERASTRVESGAPVPGAILLATRR
jgi:predicted TPR repeat methyltransferase